MTALFKTTKVISALPSVIEPNTTYWVRSGAGFDLYLSDSTGATAHKINSPPAYSPSPYNFAITGDATLSTTVNQTDNISAPIILSSSGVTAGLYGTATTIPAITVDIKGRVTKVTNTSIQTATTARAGIVKLSSDTNSVSATLAATPSAVKTVYDLAVNAIPNSKFGTALGVATLDSSGKIPSSQLPSYVDDVMEFATQSVFPTSGETGKLYVDLSNNKLFRWTGTTYVNISGSTEISDTALKLYTARTFNIAGGATSNIVSFDGSANVTLTVNSINPDNLSKATPIEKGGTGGMSVATAKTNLGLNLVDNISDLAKPISTATQNALNLKVGARHAHISSEIPGLSVPDTRNINELPNELLANTLSAGFKRTAVINNPPVSTNASPTSTYAHVLNMAGWSVTEGSGGWPTQIALGNNIAIRQGISATEWGAWDRLVGEKEYSLQVGKLATKLELNATNTIVGQHSTDITALQAIDFKDGKDAIISGATATLGATGSAPSVTLGGTPGDRIFNFVIPKGDKGDIGPQGIQGIQGDKGLSGTNGVVTDENTGQLLKIWTGTTTEYNTISVKNPNTIYLVKL